MNAAAAPQLERRSVDLRAHFLLAGATGLCIALAFLHPSLYVLAWFAFVPLLLALERASIRQAYVLGFVAGCVAQGLLTYWVAEFVTNLKGYGPLSSFAVALLFWVYSAQLLALTAALYVWLRRRTTLHELLLFPPILVLAYALFPSPLAAHLGESQSRFVAALQGVELIGVYGLDWMMCLVSTSVYVAFAHPPHRRHVIAIASAAALVIGWFAYGVVAMQAWDLRVSAAPSLSVGIVQSNEPPSAAVPEPRLGYSYAYPPEMPLTAELASAGAHIVIWPETRFKGYFEHPYVRSAFERELRALRAPLMFQDAERIYANGTRREYNTAAFLVDGQLSGTYRKIKRIAFGEYIPLLDTLPGLDAWARGYFGDFFSAIAAGDTTAEFRTADATFVPIICYETMFPRFVARARASAPSAALLVAMSNDAWFGDTREPFQHLYASVLRAVENRTTLIHVINGGPSGVIEPSGRLRFQADFRTAGGYLVEVPLAAASRTFFNRYPYALLGAFATLLAGAVLLAFARPQRDS